MRSRTPSPTHGISTFVWSKRRRLAASSTVSTGIEVSPVLWRKVQQGLSAGRVQSVAVRIVVERERERMAFTSAEYWSVEGTFAPVDDLNRTFEATLLQVDEARVATGKEFGADGQPKPGTLVLDQALATGLAEGLLDSRFEVRSVEEKPYKRSPYPPFRTSTLQQEAARKLRFSSSRTMSVAQRLYENGYITYMRTDSTSLADSAVASARAQITKLYGQEYLSPKPRTFASKVKGAQEAHEAIRPAGDDQFQTPEQVATLVGPDEGRLYDLIWKRTIASQMADAVGFTVSARLGAQVDRWTRGRVQHQRSNHHVSRLPPGLCAGIGRPGVRPGRQGEGPAQAGHGRRSRRAASGADRARDQATGQVHRGLAGSTSRGAGRGAALHLCLDHDHDPGPRLRVEEGHGPGPELRRLWRRRASREAFLPARRLQLHGIDGGRPRPDRRR